MRNWRRAYHETIDRYVRSWKEWRRVAPSTVIRSAARTFRARELVGWSDQQLEELARKVASLDIERSMNMERESDKLSRLRQGIAL